MAERGIERPLGSLSVLPWVDTHTRPLTARARRSPVLARYRSLARRVALTDAVVLVAAPVLAYAVRFGGGHAPVDVTTALVVYPILQMTLFVVSRLYSLHVLPPAEELRRILAAVSIGVTLVVTVSFWSRAMISRQWVGTTWVLTLFLVVGSRRLWHAWMGRARRSGALSFRTLIVGTNEEARRLARVMRSGPPTGCTPIGFVSPGGGLFTFDGLPVLGSLADIADVIRSAAVDCVFVASSAVQVEDVSWLSRKLRLTDVDVRVSTNLPELLMSRLTIQPIGGLPSLSVRPARLTGFQAALKRAADLTVASTLLLLTLPAWPLIAVTIKLTSRGPVFFRQRRVGRRGSTFTMLKFRSMVAGAEGMVPGLRHLNEARGPLFKIRRDPRVTWIGRMLRRWSMDELPQLLNVLRGHMSLVGPRPPLTIEVSEYEEWHFDRLEVRPGITGLGQVGGRSDLSFDESVRLDLFYIENWSLAYDLFIMAKTLPTMLSGRGAC